MSRLSPITDHQTLVANVTKRLREAIVRGVYKPGERLGQRELAERLGVSRAPIREALRILEAEGLVVAEPYRGARVTRLNPDEVREIYQVRCILEPEAVRLAVRNLEERWIEGLKELLCETENKHGSDVSTPGELGAAERLRELVGNCARGALSKESL